MHNHQAQAQQTKTSKLILKHISIQLINNSEMDTWLLLLVIVGSKKQKDHNMAQRS